MMHPLGLSWTVNLPEQPLVVRIKWTFNMLGLHGQSGPTNWDEAMKDTLDMLRAAASCPKGCSLNTHVRSREGFL